MLHCREEPDFLLGVTYTGNSLLHLAASSNFLDIAKKIWRKERSLLGARNKVLETPLHCAAKNGNHEMVSFFIESAYYMGGDTMEDVLCSRNKVLRAQNKDGETALHEAVRHNDAAVAYLLITADPVLASVIDHEGISPLYLATALGYEEVVYEMVRGLIGIEVSKAYYAGPDGQTALHAAVLRSEEMTTELLRWKPLLARMPDNSGSTPLHFAASFGYDKIAHVLLKWDHSLAYLHNTCECGSFPVHVAAKMGSIGVIRAIMDHCPDSDELLDAEGRNYLHVAAQHNRLPVIRLICCTTSTHKSMKNARDNDGNTPLHLAMHSGHDMAVKLLMQDMEVSLNIFNKKGLTLRDQAAISTFNDIAIYPLFQRLNFWINYSTEMLGAYYGARRWDDLVGDHIKKEDEEKENQKHTNAIQTLGLVSVLIATATFTAAFTMPGGYRADDHAKSGLPTLAEKYVFKAFLVSDTMAFLCAFHSTMILLFGGVTSSKPRLKKSSVSAALWLTIVAARCTLLSFSLAIFVLIAPTNNLLGILILIIGGFVFQYDRLSREYLFINDTISEREYWGRLLQNKLPENTLRQRLSTWRRYVLSHIVSYSDMALPIVITVVVPLIMVHVKHIGKYVVPNIA